MVYLRRTLSNIDFVAVEYCRCFPHGILSSLMCVELLKLDQIVETDRGGVNTWRISKDVRGMINLIK